jgi:hypothetical protein
MAINEKFFKVIKLLIPKSNAFAIFIQKKLTKFFEALTVIPGDFRDYIHQVFFDIFPSTTREAEKWKEQFGLIYFPSDPVEQISILNSEWQATGGQGADYIQSILRAAGFDVYVHENNPPVDPDIFLNSIPIMVCKGVNAYAGRDDAFAGRTGGDLLVNGSILTNIPAYLSICGNINTCCGNQYAKAGYFEKIITSDKIYQITDDPDYWGYFFFIGGLATRNVTTHVLETIDNAIIPSERKEEFKRLILKLKPAHSWVGLIVNYT